MVRNLFLFNYYFFNFIERYSVSELEQFSCHCGKSYLSQPALNNHIKAKHPEFLEASSIKGRGRPRKYPPINRDFETNKYDIFFTLGNRKPEKGKEIDINSLVLEIFQFIYKDQESENLFSRPKNCRENPVLNN